MPTIERFPIIEELRTELTPLELFEVFRPEPFCFFLDSAMDHEKLGRFSLMGGSPFQRIVCWGDTVSIIRDGTETSLKANPFDVLGTELRRYSVSAQELPVPCTGGVVGYFSYDLGHFIEKLPSRAVDDLQLPECCLGFYDLMLAYDNLEQKAWLVSTGFPEIDESHRQLRARERLEKTRKKIAGLKKMAPLSKPVDKPPGTVEIKGNFTREDYIRAVQRARQYIIDGDIFEVNLSQRFEAELTVAPYELYRRLREINPAPFAAYLECGDVTVVSASPERFLRCQGDWVETRPIKGTRRRGKSPQEDRANARELLASAKDHAENMMIVDLERNDLGRVCQYGTVKVTELAILETFPTVYHLTSTVVGQLREDKDRIDLLKATFPGGSITGAPKIRSIEIIDELEPTRRSIYTGNIGYLSFDGNMDLNIVIRTFLVKDNKAYFQAGGAVVYDSDPESEYQETLDKVRALISALNG